MAETKAKYGVFIGRFAPFHLGHAAVIDEIIADGLIPYVIVGSANVLDERTPYSVDDRASIVKAHYGTSIGIRHADDNDYSWSKWWESIVSSLGFPLESIVLYVNAKPVDRIPEISIDGVIYVNMQWWEAIESHYGVRTKQQTWAALRGITVSATDIRRDFRAQRHWLSKHTYRFLEWDERKMWCPKCCTRSVPLLVHHDSDMRHGELVCIDCDTIMITKERPNG